MDRQVRIARRRHVIAHTGRLSRFLYGATLALLALVALAALAGCGASTASAGGAGANPTATATRHPGAGKTSVRPCPGPWGNAMTPGSGVVILTPTTPNDTVSAQVGQTVEVQ